MHASRFRFLAASFALASLAGLAGCADRAKLAPTSAQALDPDVKMIWFDASKRQVDATTVMMERQKCREDIMSTSTDQIHSVPPGSVDDCLYHKGWYQRPATDLK